MIINWIQKSGNKAFKYMYIGVDENKSMQFFWQA